MIKSYPDSFPNDDLKKYFQYEDFLMEFRDKTFGLDHPKLTFIEDFSQRMQAAKEFAQKNNAQIYTQVVLDSGEAGYSKGVQINEKTLNHGIYTIVKIEGLEVDNS